VPPGDGEHLRSSLLRNFRRAAPETVPATNLLKVAFRKTLDLWKLPHQILAQTLQEAVTPALLDLPLRHVRTQLPIKLQKFNVEAMREVVLIKTPSVQIYVIDF
jgi:hypothetical protein